jgi:L-aspartate oxidase
MSSRHRTGDAAAVLVIGSGIAGLTAALQAARDSDVLLVTKSALADGSTAHAQGGIAGAVDPADTPADHAQDTRAAGAGLCRDEAVRLLCEEGPGAIDALIARGVAFDREPSSGRWALGVEGAHDRPRILHAGGDATGRAIQEALMREVLRSGRITVREHAALVDLRVEGGRVVGAALLTADGRRRTVRAGATVHATGGAGRLFSHTTNPAVATGDGIAAAWRAGAELADLEFYQFHPTALAAPGGFLISEAVRGEGAVLRDAHGRRFLPEIDERAELAPRDVVARAIAQVMRGQDGRPVLLDATGIGSARLAARFPVIDATLRAAGWDWGRDPVPVTPAAHYWMGGIRTDLDGATSLPGLYAAGECACTGVHGANRLASNSLLEGAVFGARAGRAAAEHGGAGSLLRSRTAPAADGPDRGRPDPDGPGAGGPAPALPDADHPDTEHPAATTEGAAWSRTELQRLMWTRAGLLRTGDELADAARTLAGWRTPALDALSTIAALEDRNLLDLARLLLAHALARPDSVGAHHRLDAPVGAPVAATRIPAVPLEEALAC